MLDTLRHLLAIKENVIHSNNREKQNITNYHGKHKRLSFQTMLDTLRHLLAIKGNVIHSNNREKQNITNYHGIILITELDKFTIYYISNFACLSP